MPGPAGDRAELLLRGSIAPRCDLLDLPAALTVDPDSGRSAAPLWFACNLADATPVTLTLRSEHGAMVRDDGAASIGYAIDWAAGSDTPILNDVRPGRDAVTVALHPGVRGSRHGGPFVVRLLAGPAPAAGIYSDRITLTISP